MGGFPQTSRVGKEVVQTIPIYILAGGKSSRFGSDKARAQIQSEPLLKRITRILQPVATRFTAVADVAQKYDDLNVRTIVDERPGLGPMGGLLTALKDLPEPGWLLLSSCDMVALDCGWVVQFLTARTPEAQAIAYKGERVEPLFALYHTTLIGQIECNIKAGELSPSRLIESVPNVLLQLPPNWPILAHVNTRGELIRADQTPNCSK